MEQTPNPNMYMQQQQPMMVQPMISAPIVWGPQPQEAKCCHCGHIGVTTIEKVLSQMGWLIVWILFFCCWICCWVPCCVDDLKVTIHRCTSCNMVIGVRQSWLRLNCISSLISHVSSKTLMDKFLWLLKTFYRVNLYLILSNSIK